MIKTQKPVKFNAEDPEHMAAFEAFINTNKWGELRFAVELPYVDVPSTVTTKVIQYAFKLHKEKTNGTVH